ncbi:hypothetical protein KX729_32870, partial [Rhizobium sp. XQZ8]|uniref:hypothetical protein n=1 Tax=Rhizobium populisoli TaxID=2859785 RepID=UPI001CA557D1
SYLRDQTVIRSQQHLSQLLAIFPEQKKSSPAAPPPSFCEAGYKGHSTQRQQRRFIKLKKLDK